MPNQATLAAVYDLDALKRFLTEIGMEETINIFTNDLKIKNLLVFKLAVEDTKTDGGRVQIKAALKKSGIPYAVERFEAITAADVATAIARERKKDEDAKDPRDPADAKKFDEMVVGGSEALKLLGKFLKNRALNSGKVLTVLQTSGAHSLDELKALRAKDDQWAAAAVKVKACGEVYGTLFGQITDWAIAAAIDESKQPSAEQTAARQKALAEAIAGVEKLRSDLAGLNEKAYAEKKAEIEKAHNDIVGRLAKFDLDFAAAEKPAGRDAMIDLFTKTRDQIQNVKAELAGIDKEPRPLQTAITRGDMLRGYLLTPISLEPARENLVRMTAVAPAIQNPGAYRQETITYKTSSTSSFAAASAKSLGSNLAVAAQASGGGFVGSGIAAVSVAASVVDNSIAREEESKFETATEATCGEIHYVYDPRQKIRFGETRFTDAAAARLREIVATTDAVAKRVAVARFLEIFGSHFFREVTLGGRYEFQATGSSLDTKKKGSLQTAVASARTWAFSASASYKGIGGAATAAASVISGETKATATATSYEVKTSEARVEIKTEVLGGAHGVPRDVWASSLQYSATWEVIGRDHPMAVWEMLAESKDLDAATRASLQALFEEVWVQDVFPAGRVTKQYFGLREVVKTKGIKTARALKELLEKYEPPVPVTPAIAISVVQSENGYAYDPTARASKGEQGYKLIGGGAKAEWKTMGALLTGSYPDQGAWVARAIAHYYPTDTKITAYGIYLHDPNNEWEVKIVEKLSEGNEDHCTRATAALPDGFVLTCGGARAEGGSRLLTKSYPGPDGRSWIAECRDHHTPAPGRVTAWAIGIRPRNGARLPTLVIDTQAATGQIPTVSRGTSYTLVGGGAKIEWGGAGGLLTRSYPDASKKEWCVQAKDHIGPDGSVTATVYTIALSTAAALHAAA